LVSGEKDGQQFQALNYNGIMGILVKDVKECKAEIKRLKREMAELLREDKIKKAKKEIEQLKLNNEKMSNNYRH
jgi:cell division protein FtsL